MDAKQVELLNLINNDLGMTVTEIDGDTPAPRYFLGAVETPEPGHSVVVLYGKEITHFFKSEAFRKPADQLKVDLNTYINNVQQICLKFYVGRNWIVYSRA